jgi:hypothetical protein
MTIPAGATALCVGFGGFSTGGAITVLSVQGDPAGTPYDVDDVTLYNQRTTTQFAGLYVMYDTHADWPGTGSVTVRITMSNASIQLRAGIFCLTDVDTGGTPLNGSDVTGENAASTPSMTVVSTTNALNIGVVGSYSADIGGGDDTLIYEEQNGAASSSLYVWHEDGVSSSDTVEGNASVAWAGVAASFEGTGGGGATIDVPVGSMTITGQAPTVIADMNISVNVPVGSVVFTGQEPTILSGSDISISIPSGSITITGNAPSITTSGFVNDNFDGTGALGSQWSVYNGSVIDGGVSRVSNYLEGTVSDNTSERTRWFNSDQGRFDYQTVSVPGAGFDEYVLAGVGLGAVGDRLGNLTSTGNPFNFGGLMVHNAVMSNIDYMFAVAGHRGTVHATVETKSTISGTSDVTDEGANEFGSGVTHCDLAVEIYSTGVALFKMREIGGTWRYTNGGTGLVPSAYNLGSVGTNVNIGIIGYASGTTGVPFVFTADSMTLTDNNVSVSVPVGSLNISGQAPVVAQTDNQIIGVPVGAITISSFAPFVDLGDQTIIPDSGIMTFQGFIPIVSNTEDLPDTSKGVLTSGSFGNGAIVISKF